MKKTVLALWIALACGSLWAQAHVLSGNVNLETERARLATERKAAETAAHNEKAACYQKFAVEDCLKQSRRQLRITTDDLKRQEAAINDIDRQRRGAAQLERLEEKTATPRAQDAPAAREDAVKAQEAREQRAADHAASRAATAAQAAQRQQEFADRQRAHQAEQAKAAQRRIQAPSERARYERKAEKAAEHRAALERKAAGRTKPRSAPLPAAP